MSSNRTKALKRRGRELRIKEKRLAAQSRGVHGNFEKERATVRSRGFKEGLERGYQQGLEEALKMAQGSSSIKAVRARLKALIGGADVRPE